MNTDTRQQPNRKKLKPKPTIKDFTSSFKSVGYWNGTCPSCYNSFKYTEFFVSHKSGRKFCQTCYHRMYNDFIRVTGIKEHNPKETQKPVPFTIQSIDDLVHKYRQSVLLDGVMVGKIYDDYAYLTDRSPTSFMIKYHGYGFSLAILDKLKYQGIEHIIIRYKGKTGTHYYYTTTSEVMNSNKMHKKENGDTQKFISVHDLREIR